MQAASDRVTQSQTLKVAMPVRRGVKAYEIDIK
jgi:hypothetical protein